MVLFWHLGFQYSTQTSELEVMTEAALVGHDLGGFAPIEGVSTAYQANKCRPCGKTAWVGENRVMCNLLGKFPWNK